MYTREWTVRWGDGDMFGIAYYPRIIEALHNTADMFMDEQGSPFWKLEEQHGIGLPIVEVDVEFIRPVRCGDVVHISLETELGETSVRFNYIATDENGEQTFSGYEQRVCVPFDGKSGVPIPKSLRKVLEKED